MASESPNCRHSFDPQDEMHEHGSGDRLCVKIMVVISMVAMVAVILEAVYSHDENDQVTPTSDINFTTVALAVSGLNPNTTSHPVFDVIFKYSRSRKSGSVCLGRRLFTVSYNNITLAKDVEPDPEYMCFDTFEMFVIEVNGPAISLPSSLDKEKALFDVDMELIERNTARGNFYHVSCKGLTLLMDVPVPCDTTLVTKSSLDESQKKS